MLSARTCNTLTTWSFKSILWTHDELAKHLLLGSNSKTIESVYIQLHSVCRISCSSTFACHPYTVLRLKITAEKTQWHRCGKLAVDSYHEMCTTICHSYHVIHHAHGIKFTSIGVGVVNLMLTFRNICTVELPITDLPRSGPLLYNGQNQWHGLNSPYI